MDQAGDVLADAINEAYGDALVTSLILPELFFNGFPFVFEIYYEGARRPCAYTGHTGRRVLIMMGSEDVRKKGEHENLS